MKYMFIFLCVSSQSIADQYGRPTKEKITELVKRKFKLSCGNLAS